MRTKLNKLGIWAAAFSALNAAASEGNFCGRPTQHPVDVWLMQSLQKSDGVTSVIREAQSEAYRKWDRELNEIYRALLAKLPVQDKKHLVEAQRAWLTYREAETKFLWSESMFGQDGSLGPVVIADRMRENLKARVCELQQSLSQLSR